MAFITILIIIIILLLIIIGLSAFIIIMARGFLKDYFGTTSLKEAIAESRIKDSETPKTVYSMENVYLDRIRKDFPNLNINELKSSAEMNIRNVLHSIETKDLKELMNKNDRVYTFAKSKIEDLKDKDFVCDNIKFHKTVLSRYEKFNDSATMQFQTSLEYDGKDKKGRIRIQTRFKTEFIHIIDAKMYGENKIKVLGLNCHNCGAPIKNIDEKNCKYCKSRLIIPQSGVEFVKRIWFLNNLKEY